MTHDHVKSEEVRYSIFSYLLGLSQLCVDESDVLHVFLPFPVATWQTSGLPAMPLWVTIIFGSFVWLGNNDLLRILLNI